MFNFLKKHKDEKNKYQFEQNLKHDSTIILDKESLSVTGKYITVEISNYVYGFKCCKPLLLTEEVINRLFKIASDSIYSKFIDKSDSVMHSGSAFYTYMHTYYNSSDDNIISDDDTSHKLLFNISISKELCKDKQSALILFKELNMIEFVFYNYINNKKIDNDFIKIQSNKNFRLVDYNIPDRKSIHSCIDYVSKLNNSCDVNISLKSPCIDNTDIITSLQSFKYGKDLIKKERVNHIILENKIYSIPYGSYNPEDSSRKENVISLKLFGPIRYDCAGSHFIERYYENILDFYIDYFNETKINGIKKE